MIRRQEDYDNDERVWLGDLGNEILQKNILEQRKIRTSVCYFMRMRNS